MPMYEYLCQACGHALEAIQKLNDAPLSECPKCARPQLKKQLSAPGFQLKGSGWYATDFKNGNKKPDAKSADKAEAKESTGKSEAKESSEKSDSKTDKPAACSTGCGCH